MIINGDSLRTIYVGFSAAFRDGLSSSTPLWNRVAMQVPSSTAENEYGWLGQIPGLREWIGERQVRNLTTDGYRIKNKTYEDTVGVPREAIEDDNVGLYTPLFTEMGRASAELPDTLVFDLLKAGFATLCYDGQFFFDSDHPVTDANGATQTQSNTGGGSGTGWYLLDTTRAVKPIIYQSRRPFELTRMDAMTDEQVFTKKEYRYGVDGRCNVGYGLWQFAYGSKQTLDATAYAAARAAMMGRKGDFGRQLNVRPNLLVVPPSLEAAGRAVLLDERLAGGATNTWRNTAELLVAPWLA